MTEVAFAKIEEQLERFEPMAEVSFLKKLGVLILRLAVHSSIYVLIKLLSYLLVIDIPMLQSCCLVVVIMCGNVHICPRQ